MTIRGTAIGVIRSAATWTMVADGAIDQPDQPAELGQARAGIAPGGAEQEVVGLVFAQHVVDEVGREADLAPDLALARVVALDQPADHRHFAERAT